MTGRRFGRIRVEVSRLEKVLFPEVGITKGELLDYYDEIAPVMLRHVRNRPLTLERFPDGIAAEGFVQQQRPDYFPDWIGTCRTPRVDDARTAVEHVLCNNRATLAYLVNQATITLHGWLARAPRFRVPDRLVFDLDPPGARAEHSAPTDAFELVRKTARAVVMLMRRLDMNPYLMTTGSRGLHVVAPLRAGNTFDQVREVAQRMAKRLATEHPETMTTAQRRDQRGNRIYLDVNRNAYGQTTVLPYVVRALSGAPVATPLDVDELDDAELHARRWTLKNIRRRLGQRDDPWLGMGRRATSLDRARADLAADGDDA